VADLRVDDGATIVINVTGAVLVELQPPMNGQLNIPPA
jgi:hypothetical protein